MRTDRRRRHPTQPCGWAGLLHGAGVHVLCTPAPTALDDMLGNYAGITGVSLRCQPRLSSASLAACCATLGVGPLALRASARAAREPNRAERPVPTQGLAGPRHRACRRSTPLLGGSLARLAGRLPCQARVRLRSPAHYARLCPPLGGLRLAVRTARPGGSSAALRRLRRGRGFAPHCGSGALEGAFRSTTPSKLGCRRMPCGSPRPDGTALGRGAHQEAAAWTALPHARFDVSAAVAASHQPGAAPRTNVDHLCVYRRLRRRSDLGAKHPISIKETT